MNFRAFLRNCSQKDTLNSEIIEVENVDTCNEKITTRGKKRERCSYIENVEKLVNRASEIKHIHDVSNFLEIYNLSELFYETFEEALINIKKIEEV